MCNGGGVSHSIMNAFLLASYRVGRVEEKKFLGGKLQSNTMIVAFSSLDIIILFA